MLSLEIGLPDMFLTTIKDNFVYVIKLLAMQGDKLSKTIVNFVANHIVT